jgi:hypothetical protein
MARSTSAPSVIFAIGFRAGGSPDRILFCIQIGADGSGNRNSCTEDAQTDFLLGQFTRDKYNISYKISRFSNYLRQNNLRQNP